MANIKSEFKWLNKYTFYLDHKGSLQMKPEEIIQRIEKELYSTRVDPEFINFGIVETIGDEIAKASGLSNVGYYEEVEFDEGSIGFVLNID
jgi:F-type H+-transporting ATPase subunit alpha